MDNGARELERAANAVTVPLLNLHSSVSIRVGTPPQWVDVFVSTASQETWVVGPWGCSGGMSFGIIKPFYIYPVTSAKHYRRGQFIGTAVPSSRSTVRRHVLYPHA